MERIQGVGGLLSGIAAYLLLSLSVPGTVPAAEETAAVEVGDLVIEEDTVWRGSYLVTGTVSVVEGAALRVEGGTRLAFRGESGAIVVNGSFVAEGERDRPIVFAAEEGGEVRWKGLSVHSGSRPARLSFCVFRKAEKALFSGGASPVVDRCAFENNGTAVTGTTESTLTITRSEFRGNTIGVEASMQAKVTVSDSSFDEHPGFGVIFSNGAAGRVTGTSFEGGKGILVRQGNDVLLDDNSFRNCDSGVVVEQAGPGVRLLGNTFSGGKTGVAAVNFSKPRIACGEFSGLETALLVSRSSSPFVEHSLFEGNRRAVFANQKSTFPLRKNVFRGNGEAVFVDLSSYPRIAENNFSENGMDVALGIYMSADWEERVGSGRFSRKQAASKNSRNLEGLSGERAYPGEVDARNNWWGGMVTAEMEKAGGGAGISTIHDYFDMKEVTYPKWGEGSFRLDRVLYAPWAAEAFPAAGPLTGGCTAAAATGKAGE